MTDKTKTKLNQTKTLRRAVALLAVSIALCLVFIMPAAAFSGSGTALNPYQITSAADLQQLAADVNAGNSYAGTYFTISSDISLNGITWTPIGNGARSGSSYTGNAFSGIFDGAGHTISSLTVTAGTGKEAVGLFGVVDGGTVENLVLSDVSINTASDTAGAAAGMMVNGSAAKNIFVSGSLTAVDGIGGIVGRMTISGTIEDCINTASVTASGSAGGAGGIVGKAYYTVTGYEMNIENCTNTGSVSGPYAAGGIVGLSAANVQNCINTGSVIAGTEAGGIIAEQVNYGTVAKNSNNAEITNMSGHTGTAYGGIIGWIRYQTDTVSYQRTEMISVTENTNSGNVLAPGSSLGSGGIVGNIYNQADVQENSNLAAAVSGGTFAAGIVGAAQPADNNQILAGTTVTVSNNTVITPLSAITAALNNVDLYCYNNKPESFVVQDNTDTAETYAISVSADQGTVTLSKYTAYAGEIISITDISANAGYVLSDITVGSITPREVGTSRLFMMPANPVSVTAVFSAETYTITFDTAGGSTVPPLNAAYGSTITTPEIPTKEGYTFVRWNPALPETMPAENLSVTAVWRENPQAGAAVTPNIQVGVTPSSGTGVTISASEENSTITASGNTATITGDSGVKMEVTFESPVSVSNSSVTGTVSAIKVTYPETDAVSSSSTAVTQNVQLGLKNFTELPTISSAWNSTVSSQVKADLGTRQNLFAMITASADNMSAVNSNITAGGITVTFTLPVSAVTEIGGTQYLRAYHVSDGTAELLPASQVNTSLNPAQTHYVVVITANSFSSYAVGYEQKQSSSGGSSSSSGSSGSGDYQYYPREIPVTGIISFGTSPVVTGMELPAGSTGIAVLNTQPAFTMPENGYYAFAIDAPGYNTEAKINGAISFQLAVSGIEAEGYTTEDIVLFHGIVNPNTSITWEELPTSLISVQNGAAFYKAAINSVSPFYIGFVKDGSIVNNPEEIQPDIPTEEPFYPIPPAVPETPETPETPAPIFGLVLGILGAVFLTRRH